MAEKALVTNIVAIVWNDDPGEYVLTFDARITMGDGNNETMAGLEVSSTTFNPLLPTWRSRIRDEVIAQADAVHQVEVDGVLFADLSLL